MKIALPLIDKETRHNLLFHVNVLEKRTPPPPQKKKKRIEKKRIALHQQPSSSFLFLHSLLEINTTFIDPLFLLGLLYSAVYECLMCII